MGQKYLCLFTKLSYRVVHVQFYHAGIICMKIKITQVNIFHELLITPFFLYDKRADDKTGNLIMQVSQ